MTASRHDPENLRSTTLRERRFNDLRKEANQEDQRSRIDHRENEEEHHRTEQRAAFKTHREYSRRTKFVQPITRHRCRSCWASMLRHSFTTYDRQSELYANEILYFQQLVPRPRCSVHEPFTILLSTNSILHRISIPSPLRRIYISFLRYLIQRENVKATLS